MFIRNRPPWSFRITREQSEYILVDVITEAQFFLPPEKLNSQQLPRKHQLFFHNSVVLQCVLVWQKLLNLFFTMDTQSASPTLALGATREWERRPTKNIIRLTYIRDTSKAVARLMKPLGIRITHKSPCTLSSALFDGKDRADRHHQPGVVYAIPCVGCDNAYIGEAGK